MQQLKDSPVSHVYSAKELEGVDLSRVPKHIAMIMDGNRRWAKGRGMPPFQGHYQGAKQLAIIVKAACQLGVEVLTVFAFSTENWKRSEAEVAVLMRLLKSQILEQKETMREQGVRLSFIGDLSRLPKSLRVVCQEAVEYTKGGQLLDLVVGINYGGRDEIVRAVRKTAVAVSKGQVSPTEIDEQMFQACLDTAELPPADLMIRTSGEHRISNFLLWQLSYSELFFLQMSWPEFSHIHFLEVVLTYQKRQRRYGG